MKQIWFIVLLFFSFCGLTQQLTLIETFVSPQTIDAWTIDGQQNLVVASANHIQKKAISGERIFNQTFKSLGDITAICPVNAMKIILFSEPQQSISLVDNTLTQQGEQIDLSQLGFSNVLYICPSNRPNLIWVFDQFRSSLNLVDFQKSQIIQSIQNVENKGNSILEIKEYQDHLYVLFSDGMMNRYDFLLNFSGTYALENCQQFGFWNQQIVCLDKNATSLHFIPVDLRASERKPDLQIGSSISSFIFQGNLLGIQKGQEISVYSIKY